MNVIRALDGHEAWQCGAMSAPRPLSGKAPEGTLARIECEIWRGRFHRGPNCTAGKLS